jgi:hypothetical protein
VERVQHPTSAEHNSGTAEHDERDSTFHVNKPKRLVSVVEHEYQIHNMSLSLVPAMLLSAVTTVAPKLIAVEEARVRAVTVEPEQALAVLAVAVSGAVCVRVVVWVHDASNHE